MEIKNPPKSEGYVYCILSLISNQGFVEYLDSH